METPVDLSIIIVSFNTRDLTLRCLTSLDRVMTKTDRWEVIVVDNGSTDGSAEAIKELGTQNLELRTIINKRNLGFAKANNQGIRRASGKYILLLNSDTEVPKGTIQTMLAFMDAHRQAGAATCALKLADGTLDPACHRGFPTPWAALTYFLGLERIAPRTRVFGQYHMGYQDLRQVHEVDAISGAFFLVRREVINQVKLLDENYFMYGEDLDWAYRIKQSGWKILFNPEISILHYKKQSGRLHEDDTLRKQTERHFYETMEIFYKKHYAKQYPSLVTAVIFLFIAIKRALIH